MQCLDRFESRGPPPHGIAADISADKALPAVQFEGVVDAEERCPVRAAWTEDGVPHRRACKGGERCRLFVIFGNRGVVDAQNGAQRR